MGAFVIFHSTVKDGEKFQAYAKGVGPTLQSFEGAVALRGKANQVLNGDHGHQAVGILKFPSVEKAIGWYQSADYQALIENRNEAADMTVICFEEPPA